MSRLIKDRAFVEDPWRSAEPEGTLPEGDLIVPLARFQAERDRLLGRNGGLGVRLGPTDDPAVLGKDLDRLGVIVLTFPTFTDGRAYSQARLLRERLGFKGELRAVGDVLRDQLPLMRRCGFDAFEIGPSVAADAALGAFDDYSVAYQRGPTAAGLRQRV
jgi:phosphoadenosine phosphosulfate reductase